MAATDLPDWLSPLLDAEAMRAADSWAIEQQGIPSLELMETAGRAVAEAVAELTPDGPVRVVCDIASGIDASDGTAAGAAVEADVTVSFHAAKVGHRIAPGAAHTGDLRVIDIGIPAAAPADAAAGVIEFGVLAELPRRARGSTKFSSGNVLVVGASRGLTGAVTMASQAAIRAGAGYAAAAVPASRIGSSEAGTAAAA